MSNNFAKEFEPALYSFLPSDDVKELYVYLLMRYSLEAGGKRVRPQLVYEFNRACSGNSETAAYFAASG